jgi:hypothetical protein
MKKCYFFIDDVIWCLRDIARQKPASIFDQHFLGALKKAHDMYGLKVQLNLFYRTDFYYGMDEFTLRDMPDTYKKEWEDNSDWLRFGFHSLQEFPDYPFVNADYDDVKKVMELITGEVRRFAGEKSFAKAVLTHWLPVSKEGCKAIYDSGIKLMGVSSGPKREYDDDPSILPYGHAQRLLNNRKPETGLFSRGSRDVRIDSSICSYNHISTEENNAIFDNFGVHKDEEIGIYFKNFCSGPCLNLIPLDEMESDFAPHIQNEFLGYATHEQYSYPDYFAYQSDSEERLLTAAKIVYDAGYEHFFIEELVENL